MSIPDPPPGGRPDFPIRKSDHPQPFLPQNPTAAQINAMPSADRWTTDPALRQLADRWNTNTTSATTPRWETIKHLRVLRMALNGYADWNTYGSKIPSPYFASWQTPRLSTPAKALGASQLTDPHLDIDWFGDSGTNWWDPSLNPGGAKISAAPGPPKGSGIERRLATAILHFLEASTSLSLVGKSASPVDPTRWSWATPPASWDAGLVSGAPPWNTKSVRLEWHRVAGKPDVTTQVIHSGPVSTLVITTPFQSRNDWKP